MSKIYYFLVLLLQGNKLECLAKEKKFSDIDSRCQSYITLLLVLLQENKLECFTVEKQFLRLKIYSFFVSAAAEK
jgi:hypothetical protein